MTVTRAGTGRMMRNRKLNRLKDYDYAKEGYYFVTVCVKDRVERFGEVKDGRMMLNLYGEIVSQCWEDLSDHYGNVKLDAFVVMPNHAHGIVVIDYHVGNGLKPFPTKFQWQKSFYDRNYSGL